MAHRWLPSSVFDLKNMSCMFAPSDEMSVGGIPAILLVELIFKLFDGPPQFLLLRSGLP